MGLVKIGGGASGGGISTITSDTMAANQSITTSAPSIVDTGLAVTFTATSNEYVLLTGNFSWIASGGNVFFHWYYRIDSGTDVDLGYSYNLQSNVKTETISRIIGPFTAGSRTVTIGASRTGSFTPIIYGTDAAIAGADPLIQIVQF